MSSFTELLHDPKEANRLAKYVVDANPNIKDFPEFEDALKKAFNTPTGQNALSFINDEESKLLFESKTIQETIQYNGGEQDAESFEVQRRIDKGEPTKPSDLIIVQTQPKFVSRTKTGLEYQKSYSKWSSAQNRFVQTRKARGESPKQIIYNFNQHFNQNQKSESSIRTKIYRI